LCIDGHQVTQLPTHGLFKFFWSSDDRYIVFLKDEKGNAQYHVYRIDLDTKKTEDLTKGKGFTVKILQMSKKYSHAILIGINDRNPKYHDVYQLDLTTGKKTLVYKNDA
jgi:Tol biopolymer transport system component